LCVRHNPAFSCVDTAATQLFKFVNAIHANLSRRSLSRKKECYLVSGDDLEIWATKALLGLFHSQPQDTALAGYTIDSSAIANTIQMARLPKGCGIYLNG
jgi:hypothetical protein